MGSRPIKQGSLFSVIFFPAFGPCLICSVGRSEAVDTFVIGIGVTTAGAKFVPTRNSLNAPNITPMTRIIVKAITQTEGFGAEAAGGSRGRIAPDTVCGGCEATTSLSILRATVFAPIATPGTGAAKPEELRTASAALSRVRSVWQPRKAVNRTSAKTPFAAWGVVLA